MDFWPNYLYLFPTNSKSIYLPILLSLSTILLLCCSTSAIARGLTFQLLLISSTHSSTIDIGLSIVCTNEYKYKHIRACVLSCISEKFHHFSNLTNKCSYDYLNGLPNKKKQKLLRIDMGHFLSLICIIWYGRCRRRRRRVLLSDTHVHTCVAMCRWQLNYARKTTNRNQTLASPDMLRLLLQPLNYPRLDSTPFPPIKLSKQLFHILSPAHFYSSL